MTSAKTVDESLNYDELESLFKEGRTKEVRRYLSTLSKLSQIPDNDRLGLAELSRKVDLPLLSHRLLVHKVKAHFEMGKPISDQELTCFAAALVPLGAKSEALRVFSRVNWRNSPESLFHRSMLLFTSWSYKSAIPLLKRYVTACKSDPYRVLVGQLNLAACYIAVERYQAAETLLMETLSTGKAQETKMTLAASFELLAQAKIYTGHFSEAKAFLKRAEEALAGEPSMIHLYIKKWQAIVDLIETEGSPESKEGLEDVKCSAKSHKHWESLRECDLFLAKVTNDDQLFAKVYYGTPYSSYRKKVRQLGYAPSSQGFLLCDPEMKHHPTRLFDLKHGSEVDKKASLHSQPILLNALRTILSDFYRPHSLGEIFSRLYPDETFDPMSSPSRVNRVISRLKKFLQENQIPLKIYSRFGLYSFEITGNYGFLVSIEMGSSDQEVNYLQELRSNFPYQSFSSKKAAEVLSLSQRTVQKVLRSALDGNKVRRSGNGSYTLYRFAK